MNQASPGALDALGELLNELVTQENRPERHIERSVFSAIAATRDPRALSLYDGLIADRRIEGSGFYRYQRDELARRLAGEDALARLPQSLAEVAEWMIERGLTAD
jgi:GH15 family glucan-1,4-alpha-glucosidase